MRIGPFPALLGCALALGGCAYIGLAPAVVEAVNSSRADGYVGTDFEAAATEACTARAARYGPPTISKVQRIGEKTVRVNGAVQEAMRTRAFACDFRSNGRISGFSIQRAGQTK